MDFKQIISFQKVASLKSFSKAAKALFLSQPAITHHIMELEKELNVKLYERNTKTVELSPAGELFLVFANQVIELQNDLIKEIEGLKKGLLGILKIAVSNAVCPWFVPELHKFKEYYPKVDIVFETAITSRIVDMVVNRKVHYGIIRHSNPNYNHPLLVAKGIKHEECMLVISPNHKFALNEEVSLEDLIHENLIAYGSNSDFWNQIMNLFYEKGLSPKVSMNINDFNVAKLLIQSNFGVSFMPVDCVKDEINQGLLKTKTVKNQPLLKRYSILVYRKDMILTELHKKFLRMIDVLAKKLWIPDK